MSVGRGLTIVIISAVGFGVAGGLLGLALGVGVPGYYRGVFDATGDPRFRPVEVAVGLGIGQGVAAGLVVGVVLVLVTSMGWRSAREAQPGPTKARWGRRALLLIVLLASIAGTGVVAFVAGAVWGTMQLYRGQSEQRLRRVQPVLGDPAFRAVAAEATSDGQLILLGSVATEADRARLLERLRSLFGEEDARSIAANVEATRR